MNRNVRVRIPPIAPSSRTFSATRLSSRIHPGPESKKLGTMSAAWPSLVFLLSVRRKACQRPPFPHEKRRKSSPRVLVGAHRFPRAFLDHAVQHWPHPVPNISPRACRLRFFAAEELAASLFSYFGATTVGWACQPRFLIPVSYFRDGLLTQHGCLCQKTPRPRQCAKMSAQPDFAAH
jgi:hypothetical protein